MTDDYRLIEKYLQGALSDSEQSEFNARLKSNDFVVLLKQEKSIKAGIIQAEDARLKEFLAKKELVLSQNNKSIPYGYYLKITAIIGVLVLLGWYIGNRMSASSPDSKVAEYLTPYPNVYRPVKRSSETLDIIDKGFKLYENEDYKGFIELVEQLSPLEVDDNVQFYWANATLGMEDYTMARKLFMSLTESGVYRSKSQYYLALLDIQEGQVDSAISSLKEILKKSPTNSFIHIQAKSLLESVEE